MESVMSTKDKEEASSKNAKDPKIAKVADAELTEAELKQVAGGTYAKPEGEGTQTASYARPEDGNNASS
jgi:hypothetical protein